MNWRAPHPWKGVRYVTSSIAREIFERAKLLHIRLPGHLEPKGYGINIYVYLYNDIDTKNRVLISRCANVVVYYSYLYNDIDI